MKPNTRIFSLGFVVGFVLLGAAIVLSTAVMAADSGACYSIQDSDARAYCLARAHREPAQCYSIQRADLRAQCLAEVRQ